MKDVKNMNLLSGFGYYIRVSLCFYGAFLAWFWLKMWFPNVL